jgi:hypothetical protein
MGNTPQDTGGKWVVAPAAAAATSPALNKQQHPGGP